MYNYLFLNSTYFQGGEITTIEYLYAY